MRHQGAKLLEGALLRCRGCGRTAASTTLSATRLADLLSWDRADDGDWCIECQWLHGRIPALTRRLARAARAAS